MYLLATNSKAGHQLGAISKAGSQQEV